MTDELWQKDKDVIAFIEENGASSMIDIIRGTVNFTGHTVRATVKNLVRQGYLRMKDDEDEHDWVYALNQKARAPRDAKGEG